MCYPQGDFIIGDRDVKLGEIGGAPFYISESQYEAWKHLISSLTLCRAAAAALSLDNGREKRFLTRSIICALPTPSGEQGQSSDHVLAAVGGQRRAGDEAGLVGNEEQHAARDFFGHAEAAYRHLRQD